MSNAIAPRRDSTLAAAPEDVTQDFLSFGLGDERLALPLGAVREILKVAPITPVPRAQPYVLGILSVRGRITTIMDLRRRLRMPSQGASKASRILLVDGGNEIIGLLVDEVYTVTRLAGDEIEPAANVAGDLSEYVFGIGRPGGVAIEDAERDDILILLDPEPLLRR